MKIKLFYLITLLFLSSHTLAMDAKNSFAIKGAGSQTCQRFLQENERKSKEMMLFAGWIDGYITGLNLKTKETFDFSPWQSTQLLVGSLLVYCQKHPDIKFFNAVSMMVKALDKQKLSNSSNIVEIKSADKVVYLYKEIVQRFQKKLAELNEYKGESNGEFDEATKQALISFQNKKKLEETGLPDQKTLFYLFQ